jgi:hypothetical protein
MSALAMASDANYYYVKDVEQLPKIFSKELGELVGTVIRDVRVEVNCHDGIEPLGFIGRSEIFQQGKATVSFNQFSSGQNRYLFLRCRVLSENESGDKSVATLRTSYRDELQGGKSEAIEKNVDLTFSSNRKEVAHSVNHEVVAQRELMLNAIAKDEAISHADDGNYKQAADKLKAQASKLSKAAASAPSQLRGQMEGEATGPVRLGSYKPGRPRRRSRSARSLADSRWSSGEVMEPSPVTALDIVRERVEWQEALAPCGSLDAPPVAGAPASLLELSRVLGSMILSEAAHRFVVTLAEGRHPRLPQAGDHGDRRSGEDGTVTSEVPP